MNTEHRLNRLELTLHLLVKGLHTELGYHSATSLLSMLHAPEDPDNLEGPPRTPEELARNARELDAVAPTPADKFQLMFQTDEFKTLLDLLDYPNPEGIDEREARWRDFARMLKQQRENMMTAVAKTLKERDEARQLVAAFDQEVNDGFDRKADSEKQHGTKAVSDAHDIFRLHRERCQELQELRKHVEQVIGHWRDTDWFREGGLDKEIVVGVNEAAARNLLKQLKP